MLAQRFLPPWRQVCGLDVHPKLPNIFVSVGDDKTVRVFDAVKR
jgi:hypothetical protein